MVVLTVMLLALSACQTRKPHRTKTSQTSKKHSPKGNDIIQGIDTVFSDTIDLSEIEIIGYLPNPDSIAAEEEATFVREHFVELKSVIPDLVEDIRYYGNHNFVGTRVDGYEAPVALVTKECSDALVRVANELRGQGYVLKVFDAYRPFRAVQHFQQWVGKAKDVKTKDEFYPEKEKDVLFSEGYISSRSRHCQGSTVDITLCGTNGVELDMGGGFDYFSETSNSDYTETLSAVQIQNRRLLRSVMERNGFVVAKSEWWHFSLQEEPFPNKNFDFPVRKLADYGWKGIKK